MLKDARLRSRLFPELSIIKASRYILALAAVAMGSAAHSSVVYVNFSGVSTLDGYSGQRFSGSFAYETIAKLVGGYDPDGSYHYAQYSPAASLQVTSTLAGYENYTSGVAGVAVVDNLFLFSSSLSEESLITALFYYIQPSSYTNVGIAPTSFPLNAGAVARLRGSVFSGDITHIEVSATPPSRPPTNLNLAQMSQAAYPDDIPPPVDRYSLAETVKGYDGFGASVFKDGKSVVVAFRGTTKDNVSSSVALANLQADYSFIKGEARDTLVADFQQATSLMIKLKSECPDCAFTLTGHSLGGAIAQIVSEFSGLPSTVFDAPGAGRLLGDLGGTVQAKALSTLDFINTGSTENIRAYGDLISQAGVAIGKQTTVTTPNNDKVDAFLGYGAALNYDSIHKISVIASSLDCISNAAGCSLQRLDGVQGPKLGFIERIVSGVVLESFVIHYKASVLANTYYAFDPEGFSQYELLSGNDSPSIASLVLPNITGVRNFGLMGRLLDGSWTNFGTVESNNLISFADGLSGIRFTTYDTSGLPMPVDGSFAYLLTFKSDGLYEGDMNMSNVSSVPEPNVWLLMISGWLVLGLGLRRQRWKTLKLNAIG